MVNFDFSKALKQGTIEPEIDYIKKLAPEQQLVVEARVANEKKSAAIAYILWFFLGTIALHSFYLGQWKIGLFRIILALFAYFELGAGLVEGDEGALGAAWLLIITLGIWLLVDLFRIPTIIKKLQNKQRQEIAKEIIRQQG